VAVASRSVNEKSSGRECGLRGSADCERQPGRRLKAG
jgi:hypothetical protein